MAGFPLHPLHPITYKNAYHFTCNKQKVSDNGEVHRAVHNCGASVWNLGHPFSTKNLQVAARFLENFWTLVIDQHQSPLELN